MWVDNNPASPFYGRMYISYNDYAINNGALYVTYSDDGTTWTQVQLNPGFIRDIQITGDLQGSGRVYVATMNEGAGGLSTRQNVMYRSTNGGVSWTSSNAGPSFQGPGRATSGYFADYHSSFGNTAIGGWTDGRVSINNTSQQDVFVNVLQGVSPTASPTPTPSATASPTPTATATLHHASVSI